MNLYKLEQEMVTGYDTYSATVVAANSEDDARTIHPSMLVDGAVNNKWQYADFGGDYEEYQWPSFISRIYIRVTLLSKNVDLKRGIVLSSFRAG